MPTGMDPVVITCPTTEARLPRAHGDGPDVDWFKAGMDMAPPCPRGWTLKAKDFRGAKPGSPVPTGMDPGRGTRGNRAPRLPRAHGDGPRGRVEDGQVCVAPPCPRGWTLRVHLNSLSSAGSPVPTGMDPHRA